jgi:hypothetical protein
MSPKNTKMKFPTEKVCEDCNGAGEIEYQSTQWQSRARGEPYLEWGECEECGGAGTIETDLTEE